MHLLNTGNVANPTTVWASGYWSIFHGTIVIIWQGLLY